jgi:sugar lactone lactonase YvrE
LIRAGGNGPGEALNQFGNIIQSLYVDDESAIYVADTYNDRILKWTPGELNGRLVAGSNGNGDANNQFNYVESVVVSKNGTMFICDRLNKRIQKWLKDDTKGETIVANILCGGMALDIEGSLYIAIDQEERVLKWPANQTVAGGNGQGEALNQLSNPLDIFVDLNHSVFVLDYSNNRVMKWTVGANEGVIVAGGNRQGNHTNQLDQPTSVIVDHMGTVYVTEIGNHRVVRWLKDAYDGSIIIGGRGVGNASDQLSRPNSLAFDRQGNLYVADSANHRIQMYTIDKSSCSLNK